jgi:hypothetical protein
LTRQRTALRQSSTLRGWPHLVCICPA